MGGSQSKEEQLYQAVQNANHTAVKTLRRDGTSLEWIDKDGRTPLILASTKGELFDMVITLLNLGASIKAYRPGHHGGYPLHHAAKRGLDKTVILLLSRGADPMAVNDDGQTPLDMARNRGHVSVVRILEDRICLFSGALREVSGPGFLEALAPQWVTRKIWAVVLPSSRRHSRNELVIYQSPKISLPRTVISLAKAQIEEPNFNVADPVVVLTDKSSSKAKFKFLSEFEGRKHQLEKFYRACKGNLQTTSSNASSPQESVSPARRCNEPPITILTPKYPPPPPLPASPATVVTSPPKQTASKVPSASDSKDEAIIPEDVALAMAINASLESASAEGIVPPREWRASSPSRGSTKGRGSADAPKRSNNHGSWSDSDSSGTILWGSPEAGPSRVAYDPRRHQPAHVSSQERVENIWETRVVMRNPPVRSIPVRDPSTCPPLSVVVQASDVEQQHEQRRQQENRRQEQPEAAAAAASWTVRASESRLSALFGLKKKALNAEDASKGSTGPAAEEKASGLCVVCWDAPARGVCIPCGHLAGCMNCLQEIKDKTWGCPVCRTSIQQVVKVFTV